MPSAPALARSVSQKWITTAATKLGRSPAEIGAVVSHFIRATPFAAVSAETGFSIDELNRLFSRPWRWGDKSDSIAKALARKGHLIKRRRQHLVDRIPKLAAEELSDQEICDSLKISQAMLLRIRKEIAMPPESISPREKSFRLRARQQGMTVDLALGPEAAYRSRQRRQAEDARRLWARGWTVDRISTWMRTHPPAVRFLISELWRLGDGDWFPPRVWSRNHGHHRVESVAMNWDQRRPWPRTENHRLMVPRTASSKCGR